jgi:hypothetical protein
MKPPRTTADWQTFIRGNTRLLSPPLIPEITLHLAEESLPIWQKTEEELGEMNIPPPYWAFAWAGGQALARYLLDNPSITRGQKVLDLGSGESYLILAHRPFPKPQPYAEMGPIFLHAESCPRHVDNGGVPDMLRSPQYILRGYNADDRIVYGSGQIVPTPEIPSTAAQMFDDSRIAYVHVRSASNNCYQCRIDRA